MDNELIAKGILLPSGEINKTKINLIAGAMTLPFTEMVWVTTNGDMETINRFATLLNAMNTASDRRKLYYVLVVIYGLLGLEFNEEAHAAAKDLEALDYLIESFLMDYTEIIKEYMLEERTEK